jgi:WGR domain
MRQRLDIGRLYRRAMRRLPETIDGQPPLPVPPVCPVTLDELRGAGWSLVREWGRIGSPGRVRADPHAELAVAEQAALRFEVRKRKKGYG